MKKPKPRTKFANDADERMHVLSCRCWMLAEETSFDLDMSQEDCADILKQGVLEGRLVIDFDRVIIRPFVRRTSGNFRRINRPDQSRLYSYMAHC